MTYKEKYDFIDHVVHLTLFEEDRLLNEHGGNYSGLEEDDIDSNEYYRIITERVINTLKKNNNYMQEEPVSEDLEEAAKENAKIERSDDIEVGYDINRFGGFVDGANWQKNHLWKPADGDDLPEIDREVIVLIKYNTQRNIHDEEYPTYRVGFGHRPNPNGWDGKNIDTDEVTHYTPKLYDKGGWNAPDIVYWLDIELPKEIEL